MVIFRVKNLEFVLQGFDENTKRCRAAKRVREGFFIFIAQTQVAAISRAPDRKRVKLSHCGLDVVSVVEACPNDHTW